MAREDLSKSKDSSKDLSKDSFKDSKDVSKDFLENFSCNQKPSRSSKPESPKPENLTNINITKLERPKLEHSKPKKRFAKQKELSIPPQISGMMSQITLPFNDIQNLMKSEIQKDIQVDKATKNFHRERFSMDLV